MKNQFFYTRKDEAGNNLRDSFNIEKVIRSLSNEDGSALVLLDDLHERSEPVPDIDPKSGKVKGQKRERNTYQTEITLTGEDVKRFNNLANK